MADLVPKSTLPTERLEPDDAGPHVGEWYWVTSGEDNEDGMPEKWLGCVTRLGSNYAKVTSVREGSTRISFDEFHECCVLETNPRAYILGKVEHHRERVAQLMDRVKEITAKLGIVPRDQLSELAQSTSALAVAHGTKDVEAHKKELILAQKKTLPDLFKEIEKEHELMATWMKAELIPMKAELKKVEKTTKAIEDRIFTVELYAGLVEKIYQVKKGKPAGNDEKISLFQRRHYMDEECLYAYEAGGMEFKDVSAFDKWLARPENFTRILPHPKSIVAFRVRRDAKQHEFESFSEYIRFAMSGWDKYDEKTFLYIRNGEQLFRLATEIEFDEQLFPDRERSVVFGDDKIWMKEFAGDVRDVISDREHTAIMEERAEKKQKHDEETKTYKKALAVWNALSNEQKEAEQLKGNRAPSKPWYHEDHDRYIEVTPDSVYYDDAMKFIADQAKKHNRIAVVLQGILDRSPVLHPHPDWRLWTAEGFQAGIRLVFDSSMTLTSADPPDFEEYRKQLNKSLKPGCITVGQQDAWLKEEARKENDRRKRSYRYSSGDWQLKTYKPRGNPGPGRFAKIEKINRKGQCVFRWHRTARRVDSWRDSDEPIPTEAAYEPTVLLNVSAYTPGDYKMFYADPRLRAQYLKWAPYLLAAEDYVNNKITPGQDPNNEYEYED